jgi:hypothetical protein
MLPSQPSVIQHQDGLTRKIVVVSHVPLHGTSYSHSKVQNGKKSLRLMLKETGKSLPTTQDFLLMSMVAL